MNVVVTKRFEKDTEKELSGTRQRELADIIEQLREAKQLTDVANLKKLTGYKTAYRIKFGDFRIGFLFENDTVTLSRVMNRKEIYRYFP